MLACFIHSNQKKKMDQNFIMNTKPPSPSTLLNYIFMSTVKSAAKSLHSISAAASNQNTNFSLSEYDQSGGLDHEQRWTFMDHFRYMVMLMTWFTIWVLRVLMDNFPCSLVPSPQYILDGLSTVGSSSSLSSSSDLSSISSYSSSSASSSMDLVLHEGRYDQEPSTKAIGRALSHIFALLNEIPATSRKYQFAVAMADKIVDDNIRVGHVALQEINRAALSSAFSRTLTLLYRSLTSSSSSSSQVMGEETGTWTSKIMQAVPLGSFIFSSIRFCVNNFLPFPLSLAIPFVGGSDTCQSQKMKQLAVAGEEYFDNEWVVAEKLAQELLWIANKLKVCSAVDEAMVQWSFATGLAALSLSANHRVQGFIVKITALLLGELSRTELEEVPRQVKFRLLLLWLPLFCYANNGVAYPVLTSCERAETERYIEDILCSLPASDQEIILYNWFQDFTISTSDWPNLQKSYDRWCGSSRNLLFT